MKPKPVPQFASRKPRRSVARVDATTDSSGLWPSSPVGTLNEAVRIAQSETWKRVRTWVSVGPESSNVRPPSSTAPRAHAA
ncbi:MAG: hypothetical protein GWM92_02665 [Gemmatimonadetes bacterium]|nr:hypothetical protein [Gemmatimonadota bacterium]NIR79372.1 hypothetical protein [Gemmatimonadota bacterium]NIU36496.1 hypothetical protein [Gemmatimonadota bacterium]NIV60155.1 hypothetical protein [Gemmatimonadota bacterium]NIV83404.1 hypothetical protein [Gemmatimonadota bacterium]